MLTRIRNAQMRRRPKVVDARPPTCAPASSTCWPRKATSAAIRASSRRAGTRASRSSSSIYNGQPAIREIKRVSKPGRRVYSPVRDIPTVANGLGVAILSTPKGVMSDSKAREENVGGEVLCNIF